MSLILWQYGRESDDDSKEDCIEEQLDYGRDFLQLEFVPAIVDKEHEEAKETKTDANERKDRLLVLLNTESYWTSFRNRRS